MRDLEWFNRDPNGGGWLHKIKGLKPGELVTVDGRIYRYSLEREGRDHVLIPIQSWETK